MVRVFILGNPRSGTSLLRIMLNSHPVIAAPPESGFMHWWRAKYKDWSKADANSEKKVAGFVDDLLSSKKIETWRLDRDAMVNLIIENQPVDYGDLTSLVFLHWSVKHEHKVPAVIVDKNNYYINHLNDLPGIWPSAKFIFLIRDGRDVASSYLDLKNLKTDSPYKPDLPTDVRTIAATWEQSNKNIVQFLKHRPADHWVMIRFEDLVSNPKTELAKLTSFLGVDFSEDMLTYYLKENEPSSTLDWKRKTLEEPDATKIGRYKTVLSAQEVTLFNNTAREMLNFGGYAE